MGVSFDKVDRIAGYRPAVFKNGLLGYLRTASASNMIDLKSVFPQRRDGALVYEECLDRGLIDPGARELTSKGLIVARAKVLTRTPYAKAHSNLMEVLDRADQLNADPDATSNISQIWLFGSFMRGEDTVGDIDLALVPVRAPAFSDDFEGQIEQARRRITQLPDAPSQWAFPWDRVDWLFRRAIFGARRHPLLAGAQTGTTDLASLGVPCQLIYDQARGGRVDDPILPMHPESKGRDASMEPPPSMPDFLPAPLRPMDARWLAGHHDAGEVLVYDLFRGWTAEADQVFPMHGRNLRLIADGNDGQYLPWIPKALKKRKLDGRNAVALSQTTEYGGTSIVLERQIDIGGDGWALNASVGDLETYRGRKRIDISTLFDLAAAVALILATDGERMCRRAIEQKVHPQIAIRVAASGLSEDVEAILLNRIVELLSERIVRIEPSGVTNCVAIG